MATTVRAPAGWRRLLLTMLVWMLLAGTGLGAGTPEPLRNRRPLPDASSGGTTPEATAPATATPGGVRLVPGGAAASGSGSGGSQDTTVIVTPPTGPVVVTPGVTVPVEPGQAVPAPNAGLPDGKAPGGTIPGDKLPDAKADAKADAKGGDQETHVLVTPPTTVQPVTPGKVEAVPGLAAPSGQPLPIGPECKVMDANGQPVTVPPGQAVPLPQGGKVIDAGGREVAVPPGGRVIMEAKPAAPAGNGPMTPGDFLPKTDVPKTPQAKPDNGKTAKDKPAEKTPAPKPQAAVQPRPGERLRINEEACAKHTLDFLAGCWRGGAVLSDKTQVTTRLCFDENGVGKRIDKNLSRGFECVAPMKASWVGDKLSLAFKMFRCSDGRPRTDVPVICEGCGETTRCIGSEYRDGQGMIGKTSYQIVRE